MTISKENFVVLISLFLMLFLSSCYIDNTIHIRLEQTPPAGFGNFQAAIIDIGDAPIIGIKVVLSNRQTKQKFTAITDNSGIALFSNIPSGNKYELRICDPGYSPIRFKYLLVIPEDTIKTEIILSPAGIESRIVVNKE